MDHTEMQTRFAECRSEAQFQALRSQLNTHDKDVLDKLAETAADAEAQKHGLCSLVAREDPFIHPVDGSTTDYPQMANCSPFKYPGRLGAYVRLYTDPAAPDRSDFALLYPAMETVEEWHAMQRFWDRWGRAFRNLYGRVPPAPRRRSGRLPLNRLELEEKRLREEARAQRIKDRAEREKLADEIRRARHARQVHDEAMVYRIPQRIYAAMRVASPQGDPRELLTVLLEEAFVKPLQTKND